MSKEVHCPNCNHLFELEAPDDDPIDLTSDDEQELVVAPMNIEGQCDCQDEVHKDEDGGRCQRDSSPAAGGFCISCTFVCMS